MAKQQSKTAFAEALNAAGIRSARERLDEIADGIVADIPPKLDAARESVYAAVASDAALLWEMFTLWRGQAADLLIRQAIERRSAARKASETTRGASAMQVSSPNSGTTRASSSTSGASQSGAGSNTGATTYRDLERARGHVAHVISQLDRVRVNGQPVGSVTVEEARAWRTKNMHHCRFVELLVANLPPQARIADYIKPDEADAMYARAREETENA